MGGATGWRGEIRPSRAADIPAIHQLIRDLAEYERGLAEVTATERDLYAALTGPEPAAWAHVAAREGRVAGFALWFPTYSTWTGRRGMYLEDLYVVPAERGRGAGRALLAELARICLARGYQRLEWSVLDWNAAAWEFYASLGAVPLDGWTTHRLAGEALRDLAGRYLAGTDLAGRDLAGCDLAGDQAVAGGSGSPARLDPLDRD